jgi:hypothetical protein
MLVTAEAGDEGEEDTCTPIPREQEPEAEDSYTVAMRDNDSRCEAANPLIHDKTEKINTQTGK